MAVGRVLDLRPATESIREDERILRSLADFRYHAEFAYLHRKRVFLGHEAKAARHPATTVIQKIRGQAHIPHQFHIMVRAQDRLLMTMAMDQCRPVELR